MSGAMVAYEGTDSRGRVRRGGLWGTPATIAKRFYDRGFRALVLRRDGVEVGGISKYLDTGNRTWWAER